MRIKFFSNYDSSQDLLRRFKDNYPISDNVLSFTTGEDYDVAVVFNKTNDVIKEGAKIVTFIQEPSFSPVHFYNNFYRKSDVLVVHDKRLFDIGDDVKVIESPSYMWFHDHVNYIFFKDTELVTKKKKLSMIVSGINMNVANYRKRLDLVTKILESDIEIDIFGRGLQIEDKRYKGELQNKFQGLLPYEYSIAIENSNEKNYVSEKYIDCVLCNTIPIYNGAPNIDEIYNPMGHEIIDLNSETIIEDIKLIIDQSFIKIYFPNLNKEIYYSQYNLYNKIKEIVL